MKTWTGHEKKAIKSGNNMKIEIECYYVLLLVFQHPLMPGHVSFGGSSSEIPFEPLKRSLMGPLGEERA